MKYFFALIFTVFVSLNSINAKTDQSTPIKNVIFDLGGVVFTTNKIAAFKALGLKSNLEYIVGTHHFPHEYTYFDILSGVPSNSQEVSYEKGNRLPAIMIDWHTGRDTSEHIEERINDYLEEKLTSGDLSLAEVQWVQKTAHIMLTPEILASTRKLVKKAFQLIQRLKDSKKYRLFVLSNWDKESFRLMKEVHADLFDLFDGIVISGMVGEIKPGPQIYQTLLDRYQLRAEESLFIDDTYANIETANQLHFQTYWLDHPKKDFTILSDELLLQ